MNGRREEPPRGRGSRESGAGIVVAAVIRRESAMLLARRPAHKRHGGMWEFPGGKVGDDETFEAAIDRELMEELEVNAGAVGGVLFSALDTDSGFEILFLPVEIEGEPRAFEHEEIRWVEPEEGNDLPLAPADRLFLNQILRPTS